MFRKLLNNTILIIFLSSCATPQAIDIKQPGDNVMSCRELLLAYESADLSEDIAHSEKGATDENILSGLFFFPAYFVTFGTTGHAQYNAVARKEHLLTLYNEKNCAKPKTSEHQALVAQTLEELEILKERYSRGSITDEDYILIRKQLLIRFE